MVTTRAWQGGRLTDCDFPLELLSEHLAVDGCMAWVDLRRDDEHALHVLADELDFDTFAVEDATAHQHRPKVDRYASHLFLTIYPAAYDRQSGELHLMEIAIFVTPKALVTVHDGGADMSAAQTRWEERPEVIAEGVGGLLHGLLDIVVQSHFDALAGLDDDVEALEDALFDDRPSRSNQLRLYRVRRSLVAMRRLAVPMRDVVLVFSREGGAHLTDRLRPYWQDLYDDVLRVADWTEGLRDLVTTIFETGLSVQDHRLNTVMKQLTGWAAVIAVPTAITGFYGMNVPFPGFGRWAGFLASVMVMLTASGSLFLLFRRKGWI